MSWEGKPTGECCMNTPSTGANISVTTLIPLRKLYIRKQCFLDIIGLAVMWGVPQFFTTFTANEMGWADLAYACDGEDFDSRPIDERITGKTSKQR